MTATRVFTPWRLGGVVELVVVGERGDEPVAQLADDGHRHLGGHVVLAHHGVHGDVEPPVALDDVLDGRLEAVPARRDLAEGRGDAAAPAVDLALVEQAAERDLDVLGDDRVELGDIAGGERLEEAGDGGAGRGDGEHCLSVPWRGMKEDACALTTRRRGKDHTARWSYDG